MTIYLHSKDPLSNEILKQVKHIPKCPGTCIFIDIYNSTNLKFEVRFEEWAKMMNNTFNFITILSGFPKNVVKGIGDEIMIYIPDEELKNNDYFRSHYELLMEIYATIDNIKNFPVKKLFLECKVSIHFSRDVYNITFLKGFNDYYGKGIDLAARLQSKSKPNRIVISEEFYKKVKKDTRSIPDSKILKVISKKYIEDFKGLPKPTEYRVIDV